MALLIRVDGSTLNVTPQAGPGGSFSARELVALVQCPPGYLEAIHMPPGLTGPEQTDSMYMWMDEDGKRRDPQRPNPKATAILRPIMRPDDPYVHGNVVITTLKEGGHGADEEEEDADE